VKRNRHLLLAILVYVTLDLSMASMPGAFVFDAAQSVESPHSGRGRAAAEIVIHTPAVADSWVPSRARDVVRRAPATTTDAPREQTPPFCLPRAAVDAASPSEDPH
jgi:hypothetical protein